MALTRLGAYGQLKGTSYKLPCRLATTATVTLTAPPTSADGITTAVGDRILVWKQSNAAENGIYIVGASTWTRAIDFSIDDDVLNGVQVYINEGSTYSKKIFVLENTGTIILGTTLLVFNLISSLSAISGTQGRIPKFTSSTTIGDSNIYDDGTKIGIGTTSPGAKLDISAAPGWMLDLTNASEPVFKYRAYNYGSTINTKVFSTGLYYSSTENASIGYWRGASTIGGWLTFQTNNGTEQMRIDASGNVGIGSTDMTQGKLHVSHTIPLGVTPGNKQLLSTLSSWAGDNGSGGAANIIYIQEYSLRGTYTSHQNDWYSWKSHNSISVDISHKTPGTDTRTFWERDPFNQKQYFGSSNNYTFTIDSINNRIGINAQSPESPLHVRYTDNIYGSGILVDNASGGSQALSQIQLRNSGINAAGIRQWAVNGNLEIWNQANASLILGTNNTQNLSIFSNGRVAINTGDDTVGQFVVANNASITPYNTVFRMSDATGPIPFKTDCVVGWNVAGQYAHFGNYQAYPLSFRTSDADRIYIKADGNVGIGTISPGSYKLNVNGNINVATSIDTQLLKVGNVPFYQYETRIGGDVDLGFKKLATITLNTGLYVGLSCYLEVIEVGGNFGNASDSKKSIYFVSAIRSGNVQDDTISMTLTGPDTNRYLQGVKINSSTYEIQVRTPGNYNHVLIRAYGISSNGATGSIVWADGSVAASTGIATYTPTSNNNSWFGNIKFWGTLSKDGGLGTEYLMANGTTTTASPSGSISLAAIGSAGVPNVNGATLTGSVLNLQPASVLYGGVITTGNQALAGIKSFTNTGSGQINGINCINNGTSGSYSIVSTNTSTGYGILSFNNTGKGIYAQNTGSGQSIYTENVAPNGHALYVRNQYGGIGLYVNNEGTGKGVIINNETAATGMPFTVQKNAVDKFTIDDTGKATSSGGFFNSSDAKLKDVIERDGDTVKFTWKDGRDDKIHIGYIAQEVQEKYPNQVSKDTNGMLTVN